MAAPDEGVVLVDCGRSVRRKVHVDGNKHACRDRRKNTIGEPPNAVQFDLTDSFHAIDRQSGKPSRVLQAIH